MRGRKRKYRLDPEMVASIGRRIREARESAGLTQTALGRRVGISYQQLMKYEHGKTRMPVHRVMDIAKVLGVPVFVLLPPKAVGQRNPAMCTGDETTFLALFRKLDRKKRKTVFTVLGRLARNTRGLRK
jgi:transcriptional regulator with XRE-family HTH domain